MAKISRNLQVYPVMEGAILLDSSASSFLFGAPTEILKAILSQKLRFPNTIVLPEQLSAKGCTQGAIEFLYFYYLFIYGGMEKQGRLRIVGSSKQCKILEEVMRLALLGPTVEELCEQGVEVEMAKQLEKELFYMAMTNPETQEPYTAGETIEYIPLDIGNTIQLSVDGKEEEVLTIQRIAGQTFQVTRNEQKIDIDVTVQKRQDPVYPILHKALRRGADQLTVTVLGGSDGFDPTLPANGYLLNFQGRLGVWDCPGYLHLHLEKLEVGFDEIEAIVLSHTHEDHIDVVESIREGNPVDLYCTAEVYMSFLSKVQYVMGCDEEEARQYHNWCPIVVGKPHSILGAEFEFFYSVHAIPCTGTYITAGKPGEEKRILISSDHAAFWLMEDMKAEGYFTEERFAEATSLVRGDEDLVLVDAGGGTIHGDYKDYLSHEVYVSYMHTGSLPIEATVDKHLVQHAETLDLHCLGH